MKVLRKGGIAAGLIGIAILALLTTAAYKLPAAQSQGGRLEKLIGSWEVETKVVVQNATLAALVTFTGDGNMLADETPGPYETTGHGSWVRTGPQEAAYTFVALMGDDQGELAVTLKVVGTVQYNPKTDSWSGPFKIQAHDPDGNLVLDDTGTMSGTRIAVERLD